MGTARFKSARFKSIPGSLRAANTACASSATLKTHTHTSTFQPLDKPWSQVSPLLPPTRFLPFIFIAHGRVHQSHCSSNFHRVLLTHALALSAQLNLCTQEKIPMNYTSMHSAGLELTKLTYIRLEDNLVRHRGDRYPYTSHSLQKRRALV